MGSLRNAYDLLLTVVSNFEKQQELTHTDFVSLKEATKEVADKLKDSSKRVQESKSRKRNSGIV
jgi:uncharacterized protein with GYD domain